MSKMYYSLVMCAVAISTILLGSVAQADTIGFWQFNEKAPGQQTTGVAGEIIDPSGNGHHGQAIGTPLPSYAAGYLDLHSAITLTRGGTSRNTVYAGDDDIKVPHHTDFNLMLADGQDYTIEAYINTTLLADNGGGIFTHRGETGMGYGFRLDYGTGKLALYIEGSGTNFLYPDATGNTNVADGEWHHVAVVIDADANPTLASATFYVDGESDGMTYFNDTVYLGAAWVNENIINEIDVRIGAFGDQCKRQFVGDIDMVRFSTRALTPDQFAIIPEPGTLALLFTGLIGLLCYAWRKQK